MPVKDLTISASTDAPIDDLREETPVRPAERISEPQISEPHTKPTKVGFVSLGCPKNLVDSEVMMGLLARAGAELTTRAEDADVIVVNTCSFIESAQQESVNTILEMAGHKTDGRAKKLVVAGCLVERFRDQIRKDIPEVDAVVGTGELEKILAATGVAPARDTERNNAGGYSPFVVLQSRPEGDARAAQGRFSREAWAHEAWTGAIGDLPNYLYDDATPRILATPRHMAYIKIAEGCDHPCSFCIIPQLRGQFRSRRFASVVAEAERLAVPSGAQIYYLTRVRLLSGHPVMIERGAYPDRVGVLVAGMDLVQESITERLEELGVVFADAEHVIDAVPATAEDGRLLGVRPRVPMLRERRLTTDLAGMPVEWSDDRYLGGAVAFSVRNSVTVNALSRTPRT